MGLIGSLFRKGSSARIVADSQGDLPKYLMGKSCKVVQRTRSQDVDGDKAYAAIPQGAKKPRTFWASELKKEKKRK